MAQSTKFYPSYFRRTANGEMDLSSDTLKVAVVTDASAFASGLELFSEVSGYETSGAGYGAGGKNLTGVTHSVSGKVWSLDFNDPQWDAATFDGLGLVLYDDTATNKPLIAYCNFGVTKQVSNYTFVFSVSSEGFVTVDCS